MNIEEEIQSKGLTAPRVTPCAVAAEVASEHYFTATDALVGHTRGPEWQATPSELGRKIARRNAEAKIWPLLAFRLRDQLSKAP